MKGRTIPEHRPIDPGGHEARCRERAFRRGFVHGAERVLEATVNGADVDDIVCWLGSAVTPWRECARDERREIPPAFPRIERDYLASGIFTNSDPNSDFVCFVRDGGEVVDDTGAPLVKSAGRVVLDNDLTDEVRVTTHGH